MNIRVVTANSNDTNGFRNSIQALFIDAETTFPLFSIFVGKSHPVTLEIAKYHLNIEDLEVYQDLIKLVCDMANILHDIGSKSMSEVSITIYLEAGNHKQFGWEFE